MNLQSIFTAKSKDIPSGQTISAESCVQLWYVSWFSRDGQFSGNINKEVEAFTSEKEAQAFKLALDNAFKLIRHTSGTRVTIEQRQ